MPHTTLDADALDRIGGALLTSSADAVIFSDREGLIRVWSPGAERLFGFSAEEALGRSLDLIIPERQRVAHWSGYRRVMQTGETRYGAGDLLKVPGIRKDGSRVSLAFTIVPVHDRDGRIEGLAAILRDVTSEFEELRALRKEVAASRGSV